MNISFSNTAIRYIMFVFNFIFVITGIILIGVGATVSSKYSSFDQVLDTKYFSLPNLLIATGVIIFLISFLGCYGAMRENWFFLMIFSVLLGIIFIFEFSAGIAGYVLRDQTSNYLELEFNRTMTAYDKSRPIQIMWDTIQSDYECCGISSKVDWENTFHNKSLPLSCCPRTQGIVGVFYCNGAINTTPAPTTASTTDHDIPTATPATDATAKTTVGTTISSTETPTTESTSPETSTTPGTTKATPNTGSRRRRDLQPQVAEDAITTTTTTMTVAPTYPASSTEPYSVGCETAFGDWVKSHAVDIGGVGFALAIIQLFGVGFSFHLARLLRNGNYSST